MKCLRSEVFLRSAESLSITKYQRQIGRTWENQDGPFSFFQALHRFYMVLLRQQHRVVDFIMHDVSLIQIHPVFPGRMCPLPWTPKELEVWSCSTLRLKSVFDLDHDSWLFSRAGEVVVGIVESASTALLQGLGMETLGRLAKSEAWWWPCHEYIILLHLTLVHPDVVALLEIQQELLFVLWQRRHLFLTCLQWHGPPVQVLVTRNCLVPGTYDSDWRSKGVRQSKLEAC